MNKHILIVDDEAEIRDTLREFLKLKNYRVSTAATAAEAMRNLRQDPPQLVITDLQMEDTDGLVLIEQIKAALPQVPILLLTGVVFDPEVIRETISKMVASYLDKTTPLDRIVAEIRRLLGESSAAA
jgi:DNA-binding NtrC family response regulator